MEDLAEIDPRYRCIMKVPQKKYVLRSVPYILHFWYGVMDGIGANRASCAFRRAGGVSIMFRRTIVWENFSKP